MMFNMCVVVLFILCLLVELVCYVVGFVIVVGGVVELVL